MGNRIESKKVFDSRSFFELPSIKYTLHGVVVVVFFLLGWFICLFVLCPHFLTSLTLTLFLLRNFTQWLQGRRRSFPSWGDPGDSLYVLRRVLVDKFRVFRPRIHVIEGMEQPAPNGDPTIEGRERRQTYMTDLLEDVGISWDSPCLHPPSDVSWMPPRTVARVAISSYDADYSPNLDPVPCTGWF